MKALRQLLRAFVAESAEEDSSGERTSLIDYARAPPGANTGTPFVFDELTKYAAP